MTERGDLRQATARVLDRDEVEGVLSGAFYGNQTPQTPVAIPEAPPPQSGTARTKRETKPAHYKVICISMYMDDLQRLDSMVENLKARGLTKANRSALIRYALGEVDLEKVPKGL